MTVAEQLEERGIEKGVEKGIEQGVEKTAVNMLQKHASMDFIAEVTGFTKEKLIALAKRFHIPLEPQAH